jgi:hypothetical protein
MSVPASKVKALCTDSEVALVRASRTPELEKHTAAELKPLATRARKLFDKWQGLSRKQARTQNRQVGAADQDTNTRLKAQVFREALDAFDSRRAVLDKKSAAAAGPLKRKSKQARASEHRQTRAAVRKGMTAALDLTNAKPVATKRPTKAAAAKPKPAKSVKKPTKTIATKTGVNKAAKTPPAQAPTISPAQQLRASTVAKQSRVARSGQTTRVRGHVTARGKRDQARRDSKN